MEQALVTGLTQGSAYALLAVGLVLVYLVSGVINLAHGAFAILAILVAGSLTPSLGLVGAIAVAVLVTAVLGALMERYALRRVADAPPLSALLLTVGLAFALSGIFRLVWGPDEHTVRPISGTDSVEVLGAFIAPQSFWLWGGLIAVVGAIVLVLNRTFAGRTVVACAQQELGARLSGVPVGTVRMLTFAVAAATGALVGVLFGSLTFITYESGLPLVLRGLIAAALAGMRSVGAAVAGGLFLGLCEAFAVTYISSQLKTPIAFAVLVAVLAIRPTGFARARAHA